MRPLKTILGSYMPAFFRMYGAQNEAYKMS